MNAIRLTTLIFAALVSGRALADPTACDNGVVSVETSNHPELFQQTCNSADKALTLFKSCNLPEPPVTSIVPADTLPPSCLALYHCAEDYIEMLTPDALARVMQSEWILSVLQPDALYDSLVVHELAHAVLKGFPCPYGDCMASAEYFAFSLQFMSLEEQDRARIEAKTIVASPVRDEEIDAFLFLVSPSLFAAKTWSHLQQQTDSCGFLRDIAAGTRNFDRSDWY